MRSWRQRRLVLGVILSIVMASAACNKNKDQANSGPNNPGPGGGPGRSESPIHQVMSKIGQGKPSLTMAIGQELNAETPDWGKIQPQAKEYAELATKLGEYKPPRGSEESWSKQTSAFAFSAKTLDEAAAKKDVTKAKEAHAALSKSCMDCHREHKGKGGPGGPRGR
jgi:hypothetical protein